MLLHMTFHGKVNKDLKRTKRKVFVKIQHWRWMQICGTPSHFLISYSVIAVWMWHFDDIKLYLFIYLFFFFEMTHMKWYNENSPNSVGGIL